MDNLLKLEYVATHLSEATVEGYVKHCIRGLRSMKGYNQQKAENYYRGLTYWELRIKCAESLINALQEHIEP